MSKGVSKALKKRQVNDTPAVLRISLPKAKELLLKRQAKAKVKVNDPEDTSLDCIVDTGMIQNGYPSVSWSHTEANIQVSHLVLLCEKGEDHVPYRSKRETASHLCHNKLCIRKEHIIKETVGANGRRNGCLAFVKCPECDRKLVACGHKPQCLLPFPK